MQNFTRRLSATIAQPLFEQFFSVPLSRTDSVKSIAPTRTHLTIPDESARRASVDSSRRSAPVPTIVTLANNKATTIAHHSLSATTDGQRTARFSSLSSSYAQFLKQRDMDKVKKIVSDLLVECCANLLSSRTNRSNGATTDCVSAIARRSTSVVIIQRMGGRCEGQRSLRVCHQSTW